MSLNMDLGLLAQFNAVEKTHWWWEGRRQLLHQLVSGYTPDRILDIGCGTGETMSYFTSLFPKADVVGVDSLALAVKYAKSRGHKHVVQNKAEHLPFPPASFDLVLLLDVLEHIPSDQQALDEAYRVLKPGGLAVITTPALPFIWSRHDTGQGHLRRYTPRMWKQLTARTGFSLQYLGFFNCFLSLPIILIRLLGNFQPLSFLSSYNNTLNYNVVYRHRLNTLLRRIFITEISLLRYLHLPLGISLGVLLKKPL